MSDLAEFVVILTAIVLAVPLARRCRLGAVIGYLIAGVVIGPSGLGLIRDHEAILHIGELGVVLLLFLIGLELKPSRLWALRRPVFGLGGVQVLATGAVATLALRLLDYPPAGALVALEHDRDAQAGTNAPSARNWNRTPSGMVTHVPGASSATCASAGPARQSWPAPARQYQISSTVSWTTAREIAPAGSVQEARLPPRTASRLRIADPSGARWSGTAGTCMV